MRVVGRNGHAVHVQLQLPRNAEHGIPDGLGFEPPYRHVLLPAIPRILLLRLFRSRAAHAVRLRVDQHPDGLFHRPAIRDEALRQPVEQLGVRGQLTQLPEIIDCAHEPRAEKIPPDPVDHHTRGERIRCARHRVGQLQPRWTGVGLGTQRFEVTPGDCRSGILRVAANQQRLIAPAVVEHRGRAPRDGHIGFKLAIGVDQGAHGGQPVERIRQDALAHEEIEEGRLLFAAGGAGPGVDRRAQQPPILLFELRSGLRIAAAEQI